MPEAVIIVNKQSHARTCRYCGGLFKEGEPAFRFHGSKKNANKLPRYAHVSCYEKRLIEVHE